MATRKMALLEPPKVNNQSMPFCVYVLFTLPLIYIPLKNNSIHCCMLHSTNDSDTCKVRWTKVALYFVVAL